MRPALFVITILSLAILFNPKHSEAQVSWSCLTGSGVINMETEPDTDGNYSMFSMDFTVADNKAIMPSLRFKSRSDAEEIVFGRPREANFELKRYDNPWSGEVQMQPWITYQASDSSDPFGAPWDIRVMVFETQTRNSGIGFQHFYNHDITLDALAVRGDERRSFRVTWRGNMDGFLSLMCNRVRSGGSSGPQPKPDPGDLEL